MTIDLDRLRELAAEPKRTAMPRREMQPSLTAEVLRQKQEITALRRGLAEAITGVEECMAEAERSGLLVAELEERTRVAEESEKELRETWEKHIEQLNEEAATSATPRRRRIGEP